MESYVALAYLQYNFGQSDKPLFACEQAIRLGKKLVDDNPTNSKFQDKVAQSYFTQAMVQCNLQQNQNAIKSLKIAVAIQEKLSRDNPAVTSFRHHQGKYLWSLGNLQCDSQLSDEGLESGQVARDILKELINKDPSQKQILPDLASSHLVVGKAFRQKGQRAEALSAFRESIPVFETVAQEDPGIKEYNRACYLVLCTTVIGDQKKGLTPEEKAQRTKYAGEAMAALRQAVAAGYANANEMNEDPRPELAS